MNKRITQYLSRPHVLFLNSEEALGGLSIKQAKAAIEVLLENRMSLLGSQLSTVASSMIKIG